MRFKRIFNNSAENRNKLVIWSCLFFLPVPLLANSLDIDTEQVEKSHQLENIRNQIKTVEADIERAKKEIDELYEILRENETAAMQAATSLEKYEAEIQDKDKQLKTLKESQNKQEQELLTQRAFLAGQVRAAYKTGRNTYLKLILNQEDPDLVGRLLAYHEYDARARAKRINEVNTLLKNLEEMESRIAVETEELIQLKSEQQRIIAKFESFRMTREETANALNKFIDTQGQELSLLTKSEEELSSLVEELNEQDRAVQIFEEIPPFDTLRGQLQWPVNGSISSRFGSLRKGGKLKWQGVNITAESGKEVKAVSAGKVVFADWFKNMGLLMILDHGDGFMSLYGHNDRLLRKPGDWVKAGELIARVGDSGGQSKPGLYFEIRKGGDPVNPALWCKK